MSKSTLLRVDDISRSPELPPDTRLVLDFGREAHSGHRVQAWREQGFVVTALLASVRNIHDPALMSFVEQADPTIVVVDESPSVEEALDRFPPLTRAHLTFELPLRSEHDVNLLKILSSLGVRTRVSFDAIRAVTDEARDAMYEAVLRPGRRAPISPFSEMQLNFRDENFEVECLDYRENDHFVDLRSAPEPRPRDAWDDVRVDQKRVPFLLDLKECAFCEGLLLCHGYLGRAAPSLGPCRAMLSEFIELHNLAYARSTTANAPERQRVSRSESNERNRW